MMNIVSANRIKVFCLAVFAVLAGANNEVWAGDYSTAKSGPWDDPSTWVGGVVPSGVRGNKDVVTIRAGHEITISSNAGDVSQVILKNGSHLIINAYINLTGDGGKTNTIYADDGTGGTITIGENVTVVVEKTVYAKKNLVIDGSGELDVWSAFKTDETSTITVSSSLTLLASPPKNGSTDVGANIIVEGNVFKNEKGSTNIKSLTINGGTYKATNNSTVTNRLILNGGTLEVQSGKKLTATANPIQVTENSTIKCSGKPFAAGTTIAFEGGETLTIEGNVDLSSVTAFTGSGNIKVFDGSVLTLNGNTFDGDITILKDEEGTGVLNITGNLSGGDEATFKTEVSTTLNSGCSLVNVTKMDIADGTFTNNGTISDLESLTIGADANFSLNTDLTVSDKLVLLGGLASGNIAFGGNEITFGSNSDISDEASLSIMDDVTINGYTGCVENVTIEDDKDVEYNSASTKIIGAQYGDLTIANTGNVTLCGDVEVTGAADFGGGVTVANGQTLTLSGAEGTSINGLTLQDGATLVANGDLTIEGDAVLTGTISGGHKITLTGDNVDLSGLTIAGDGSSISIESDATISNFADCGAPVSIADDKEVVYNASSSRVLGGTYSKLTISGNAELCGNVIVNGEVTINGEISGGYSITANGGTVNLGENAALADDGSSILINGNAGSVVINGYKGQSGIMVANNLNATYDENSTHVYATTYASLKTEATAFTINNDVTVTGKFDVALETEETLTISGNKKLTLNGEIAGGKTIVANGATIEIGDADAAVAGTFVLENSGALVFKRSDKTLSNLNVGAGCSADFQVSATLVNPTLTGGVNLKAGETLTLSGNIVFGENDIVKGAGSHVVVNSGSTICNLTGDFGIEFDGDKNITYDATSTKIKGGIYNNLTVNGNAALCGDVEVSGALAWNANITLAGRNLTLANGIADSPSFGENNMIVVGHNGISEGSLIITKMDALTFPIGTTRGAEKQYAPVCITGTLSGTGAFVSVTSANKIDDGGSDFNLKRSWNIVTENLDAYTDATITLIYDNDDSGAGLFTALKHKSATLDPSDPNVEFDRAANTFVVSGLNDFSGHWTAIDNSLVAYSKPGVNPWNGDDTWEDKDGNPILAANITEDVNIFIREGTTVNSVDNIRAKIVEIEGDFVKDPAHTMTFSCVTGKGKILVDGVFSTGGSDVYEPFLSIGGGTVELTGDFSGQEEFTFNNLVLNASAATTINNPNTGHIYGDLTIKEGSANVTISGGNAITVDSSIVVSAGRELTFNSARTITAGTINTQASGSKVQFTTEEITISGDSITLLGTGFEVASTLTLDCSTSSESDATIGGEGTVSLNEGKDLNGEISFANLKMTTSGKVDGNITTTNFLLDANVTIYGDGKLTISGATPAKTITVNVKNLEFTGSSAFNESLNLAVNGGAKLINSRATKIKGNVSIDNGTFETRGSVETLSMAGNNAKFIAKRNIIISGNATLAGVVKAVGEGSKINFQGNLDFAAIDSLKGNIAATENITISSLEKCLEGYTFEATKTVTYESSSDYMLSGTYSKIILKSSNVSICGDISVDLFDSKNEALLNGDGERRLLTINDSISNSTRNLSFDNINVVLGKPSWNTNISTGGLTLAESDSLIVKGNVNIKTNPLTFGGTGEIVIDEGAKLTNSVSLTFANNQVISGNGTFEINANISSANKLTTSANVIKNAGANSSVEEYEVKGGVFTNKSTNTINKLTLCDTAKFVVASATNVTTMILAGGESHVADTLELLKNQTLTVGGTGLDVQGNTVIINGTGSKIAAANIEMADKINLTIDSTMTLTSPLNLHRTDTITGRHNPAIAWDSDEARKIIVATGKKLVIVDSLEIGSNVTLAGSVAPAANSKLKLGGSEVTFTTAANFGNTAGQICFTRTEGVTIKSLQVDPKVESAHLEYMGTVTYDAACTSMLPGVYPALTLETEAAKNISLFDSVTVVGDLTWTNGRIMLNGKVMTIGEVYENSEAFSSNKMVVAGGVGTLIYKEKTGTSGRKVVLPVGTYTYNNMGNIVYRYSPVTVSGITTVTGDTIKVSVEGEALSGSSSDLCRYWTIKAKSDLAGTLTLQYDDADDVKGFGASDGHYWSVFVNGSVLDESNDDLKSPFSDNKIIITSTAIRGVWTAVEYPMITTLYSYKTGAWHDWHTWTTISDGSKMVNPGELAPTEENYYDIVILGSDSVYVETGHDFLHARSITLKGQDTKLTVTKEADVDVNNLLGKGTFVIKDRAAFPHIERTDDFMSADGGTIMFCGSPVVNEFELKQTRFNNLVIKYAKNNMKLTLPDTTRLMMINGNLEIDNGALVYTADSQAIHVNGDIDIAAKGKILTTVTFGAYNHADTLQVRGNLYNRGKIALTNRVWNDYTSEATVREGNKGRGIIRFVGESNNRFECYDTTNFSQLIVDKGVDATTYKLTVYSEGEKSFGLLGCAVNEVALPGFEPNVAYPADPEVYYKPLWIKCGTLELTGDVHIRSMAEPRNSPVQYDCAYIPASGCLHLNGSSVKVDATISTTSVSYASIIPAGRLIVEEGTFDGRGSSGITFVGTSYIEVKGHGKMRLAQFRPSNFAANGTTTFILSDEGEVLIDGAGEPKTDQAAFLMPDATYKFDMTGGTLEITTSVKNGGAFVVKSNPNNGRIDGGQIIINTSGAWSDRSDANYLICSELPLYDLVLKNEGNNNPAQSYTRHYIDNKKVKINNVERTVNASTVIKHNLVIEGNVVFDTYGKKITVGGNLEVKDGATVYTYKDDKSENEFVMNGEGWIKIDGDIVKSSNDATPGFFNLTIDEDAIVTMKNNIDVRGKFTLAEGAQMHDGNDNNIYTLYGDAEIDGTYERAATGAGKIVVKGTKIYSKGNGTVNNLEINTGDELQLLDPTNNGKATKLTVTGKLDFASDTRFNIGISNLTLGENATVEATGGEFGTNRMILTLGSSSLGVTKVYGEGHQSFQFPFGFNSGGFYYTPATISYTAADVWGSVTTRPVSGYAFRTDESLNCYWINSETGFDNAGTMTFTGYWYNDALTPKGFANFEAGRRNGGDWECYGTASVNTAGRVECPEERYMLISDVISASGYYSCGINEAFLACTQLFTSKFADGDTVVNWKDASSWSLELGGDPAGVIPTDQTAVQIGGPGKNHKVVITESGKQSASLNIVPGSSLDLGTTKNHNFRIIEVDEAVGAGILKLASNNFPGGDFVKFLGAHGGTVKYYVKEGVAGYTLPNKANYCNLIVGGYDESHQITMRDQNLTVYRDFTVEGWAKSNSNNSRTITIDSNMVIASGRFSMWEDGSKKKVQTYKVSGDVTVADGAEFIADGSNTPVGTANKLEISGNLDVDGVFNASNGNCVFNTVFKGSTDSRINNSTNENIRFNNLECNKDNLSAKLVLTTNKIQSATEGGSYPDGYLLQFTRGTVEVNLENPAEQIVLAKKAEFTIPADGCLSIVSGKVFVAYETDASNLVLYGQIIIENNGSLMVGALSDANSKYNSLTYAPEGRPTITINGGSLIVNGQISRQRNQTMGSLVWEQSGGDVVINGHNRDGDPAWLVERAAFEIKNSGSFTMSGGTITTKAGGGVDACGDIYIIPTTANCTGGTIIVGGGSQKLHTTVPLCHLKVNSGSSLAVYNHDLVLDSLTIEGTGVFNAQAHKITIHKAFANHNNHADDLVNKTSSGYVTGSSSQVTRFEGDVALECIGDFSTQFGMLEIEGNLTLKQGCSKISVAGDLKQNSGTVTDNGNTISLYGDLWYEGVFDGTGGIDFCNTEAVQTIRGNENNTRSLGTVFINNPNEVFLNTQLHITNSIVLGASIFADHNSITLGANAVILPKDELNGFSNTRMIRLNGEHGDFGITKYVKTGNSSFILPVGIVDNGERHYTPAEYSFSSNAFDGASITIKPINFLHRNLSLTPSRRLNYYWNVVADGFVEATTDISTACQFSVEQTYTFTDSKITGDDEKTMLPEYLYSGITDYKWIELGNKAEISGNQIIFHNFGHISGDYTAGVIGDDGIYTGLRVLYSHRTGDWETAGTWEYLTDEEGADPTDPESWPVSDLAPNGNPIHIRPGDTVKVNATTEAYCLSFDIIKRDSSATSEVAMLDIGATKGSDFGPVTGTGWLRMEPDDENHQYKMPAGNFDEFLRDERTVVEFGGANGFLPNTVIGHVSLPLQNVVLSGSGLKTLTKEDGEYINGFMEIRSGTQLKFNNTPIYIMGDWIDYNKTLSGFDGGTSDAKSYVEFNGTSSGQNLSLSNTLTAFWKLKINNSNGVTIVRNDAADVAKVKMNIGKQLALGNGLLTTTSDAYPVMASVATITDAGASSYVDGPLGRIMDNNSTFTFPVGDDSEYAPMVVLGARPVVANEEWVVTYHNSEAFGGDGFSCDPTLTKACRTEYWTVEAPAGAKAQLRLRVNTHTFGGLENSNLKRVKVVGLDKDADVWHVINSSHVSGTTIPLAMVATSSTVNLNNYRAFTLGYAGASANLLISDVRKDSTFYICDGNGEDYDNNGEPDKVEVPIYFTGIGGPYVVKYNVSLEGFGSKDVVKTVTVDENNVGWLTFTGYELGEMFSKSVGYNTNPYKVKLVRVTEDGDNAPIPNIENTASIYVMYNALPEITGARFVGMRDTRVYTVDNSGTLADINPYTWQVSCEHDGLVSVISPTTVNSSEPKFKFEYYSVADVPTEYDVTLKVTKVYQTIKDASYTCRRWAEKPVSVKIKPQPQIHSVTTNDVFAACSGSPYKYETEAIDGHTYTWKVVGGTPSAATGNECTVVWDGSNPGKLIVYDTISFQVSEDPEVWDKVGGVDSAEIVVYEGISLGEGENTLSDNTYVCDNTYGSIVIGNINGSFSYTIYKESDNTALSETFTGRTGSTLAVGTKNPLQYNDGTSIPFYVVVQNLGCSDTIDSKTIEMLKKPVLANVPDVSSADLYVGNLALINGAVREGNNIAAIDSFSFVYSGVGVTYDDDVYGGEKPDDWGKKFDGYDRETNNILKVKVPFADKLKGSLNVYSTTQAIECSSSYDIDAGDISHDYLWRGHTTDWNSNDNWWAGTPPGENDNVVIRSGKYISDGIGASDSENMKTPKLSESTSVRNVKIESGEIKVDDYTLTINGDVDCAGKFTGAGTVRFTDAEHTVSGSSVEFANLTNEGTVTANSNLAVKGNLTNSGSFVGTDTVKLSGTSSAQTIAGNGSFANITFSNPNGVTVSGEPTFNGTMSFASGLVTPVSQINVEAGGSMVKTGNSWVVGTVQKTWATGNTDPFTFIVGSENRLGMVGVEPNTGGNSFTASYTYTASTEPVTSNMPTGMTRASGMEMWDVHGPVPSKLTLYWADDAGSGISDMQPGLVIAHKIDETNWEMIDNVTVNFTGKNIKMNTPVTSYSGFTFGTTSVSEDVHPLPVTFATFTGRQIGNSVVLEWATMSESDNDYFEIERSLDGVNYVTIGYVDGAGDSDRRIDYTFSDNAPESGYCYYRLSQVDFDGTRAYADKVISVQYTGDEVAQLTIVPNPTDGRFRVSATSSMAGGVVQLLSQTGNVLRTVNVDSFDATLDISDLPSGIYVLRFTANNRVLQQKVVKF